MKINTTNTTNKNKKRVAITTIICAMVVFAMVVVGCGIKKNSTVAEAEADVIATVGTTIDTTETVEETTETIVEETTEIVEETTETVEETTEIIEEPSVETPSENKPNTTTTTTETPSENKPSNTTTETTTETPSVPTTTETPSVPSEPTTTETTTETPSEPTPNVEKCMCGTPMQMMSGYILHRAEGYYAPYVYFSNGEKVPYEDRGDNGEWIGIYMIENGIGSYTIVEHFVVTTPEWREENVTRMCCPSCRATSEGFIAY